MGVHVTFWVSHNDLDRIAEDKNFGYELSWRAECGYRSNSFWQTENKGWRFLGHTEGTSGAVICVYQGKIWGLASTAPKISEDENPSNPSIYTLLSLSLDVVVIEKGKGGSVGKCLRDSILAREEYVDGLDTGIKIGPTFSTDTSAVYVDAGGCFWQFGTKSGIPAWVGVKKRPPFWTREATELELALQQGIDVDLTRPDVIQTLRKLKL